MGNARQPKASGGAGTNQFRVRGYPKSAPTPYEQRSHHADAPSVPAAPKLRQKDLPSSRRPRPIDVDPKHSLVTEMLGWIRSFFGSLIDLLFPPRR
jgi:hypothetical protein